MAVLKYKDTDGTFKEFFVASPGVSWIPEISSDLILSWSNNAHLPNPDPVSLKTSGVEMYPSIAEFPVEGQKLSLYIDQTTNMIYRYDPNTKKYYPLSTTDDSPRSVEIVTTLPTTNINPSTIYCMRYYDGNDDVNRFDEYMWINNDWELISSSSREGKVDESQRASEEDVRHLFG